VRRGRGAQSASRRCGLARGADATLDCSASFACAVHRARQRG
jgi:hypothetical protein